MSMVSFLNSRTFIAVIGCFLLLSVATPAAPTEDRYRSNEEERVDSWITDEKENETWPSIQLHFKGDELEEEFPLHPGTIPAWIGYDGRMRVPSRTSSADFQLENMWTDPSSFRRFIDDNYGVVLPLEHNHKYITGSNDVPTEQLRILEPFIPWVRRKRFHTENEADSDQFYAKPFEGGCSSCVNGFHSPTLAHSDGSDVFRYEYFDPDPDPSFTHGINYSEIPLPQGCYFCNPRGHLVCDSPNIFQVPEELPRVPLTTFEMNLTQVSEILSNDFDGMNVTVMKIVMNPLSTIEMDAFSNISNLISLSLDRNQLSDLNWQLFSGLDNLVFLSLRGNRVNLTDVEYPPAEMPSSEPLLPLLVYLDLAENPLGSLNKNVFRLLENSPIEELNLKSCTLSYIHQDAFKPLKSLRHLDLFNNPKLLFLNNNSPPPVFPASLIQLGLASNKLFLNVPKNLIRSVGPQLRVLNLSGNFLPFLTDSSVLQSNSLTNLSAIILESCTIYTVGESVFANMTQLSYLYLGHNQLSRLSPNVLPSSVKFLSIRQNPQVSDRFNLVSTEWESLENLMWLDMNYMKISNFTPGVFNGLTNLLILQLRGSELEAVAEQIFEPLHNLLILDMGENEAITTLPQDFSSGLFNLLMLFLDRCALDFPASLEINQSPFKNLKKLVTLQLSNNNIRNFDADLVNGMNFLHVLYLKENLLSTWERKTTAYMPKEALISVSSNRITFLPEGTYEEFANIRAIDLSDNAFTCNCPTYDIVKLAESSNTSIVRWEDPEAYICTDTTNGQDPVIRHIKSMKEEDFCGTDAPSNPDEGSPSLDLWVIGLVVGVVLLAGVIGGVYYNRNNIWRSWFVYRHGRRGLSILSGSNKSSSLDGNPTDRYEYDAFISFNEQDRSWVYDCLVPQLEARSESSTASSKDAKPAYKLCLHDRDFTVGQRITENIIENIAKSRKVIIVLSRKYVESKWCQFELHLSHHRLLETERRDALVLVLLEDVPKQQQNAGIRYLMRTRTYLPWRNDIEGQKLFWKRLYQVLESPIDFSEKPKDSSKTESPIE